MSLPVSAMIKAVIARTGAERGVIARVYQTHREALGALWSQARTRDPLSGVEGAATLIVTLGRHCPGRRQARYRLTSVDKLIPSHSGVSFAPMKRYPKGVQERRYHKDKTEQQKVIDNSSAGCFVPALLANTDPTALGGCPIATNEGYVLGGNSRAMVLQRIYHVDDGAAERYRDHLRQHATWFGFTPAQVEAISRPVVVRVVDTGDLDAPGLADLVRRYNETLTQDLDATAAQVATSRRIDTQTLDVFVAALGESPTLKAFFDAPSSRDLIRVLIAKEVIPKTAQGRYIAGRGRRKGLLTEEGQRFIARALAGVVLPDPDLLDQLTGAQRNNLAMAAPFILQAAQTAAEPAKWDVRHDLAAAVRLVQRLKASELSSLSELARQQELDTTNIDALTTANVVLAEILLNKSGPRQLVSGFRCFANKATASTTALLFGEPEPPVAALATCFKVALPQGPGITPASTFSGWGAPLEQE